MNSSIAPASLSRVSRNAVFDLMTTSIASVDSLVVPTDGVPAFRSAAAAPGAPVRRTLEPRIALLKYLPACIIVAAMCTGRAEAQLLVTDSDSCVITRTEEFAGAALAGHINGGAELYREYGFKHLAVHYVRLLSGQADNQHDEGGDRTLPPGRQDNPRLPQGQVDTTLLRGSNHIGLQEEPQSSPVSAEEELVVESYQMQSPLAAYGIYSISRHECGERDTAFTYSCSGPYQIQCAADSWYVRILNGTGSLRAQAGSRALLRSLALRTGQPRIQLPGLFLSPALDGMQDRVLLMTGTLGVQNGLPDWSDLLEGVDRFALYAVRLDGEHGIVAELQLSNGEDAARVAQVIGVPTGERAVRQTAGPIKGYALWRSPVTLRVLETTAPRSALGGFLSGLSSAED